MTQPRSASAFFASMIEEYDSLIRRAVPRYDEMVEQLVRYLPSGPARVVELGCGTGNLTLALLRERPEWVLTTVDASHEMVELTRSRVESAHTTTGTPVTFVTSRFEELALDPATFDVVVSSISLHHVEDKAPLFRSIRDALAPGGTLRFSDQIAGASAWNDDVNWASWLETCRLPGNCSESEIDSLIEHSEAHDHYVSLSEHFALLRAAGFGTLDCVWRDGMWGVITADV